MFWYIIGYIAIGFIGGALYWGMFNEEKYSHYYNTWENTEDGGYCDSIVCHMATYISRNNYIIDWNVNKMAI